MKKEEALDALLALPDGQYILDISYKYEWDDVYYSSFEVCEICVNTLTFFDDWDEGQDYVEIHRIVSIDKLMQGEDPDINLAEVFK